MSTLTISPYILKAEHGAEWTRGAVFAKGYVLEMQRGDMRGGLKGRPSESCYRLSVHSSVFASPSPLGHQFCVTTSHYDDVWC